MKHIVISLEEIFEDYQIEEEKWQEKY